MDERSRIYNGQFRHDLSNWTASAATYNAGDGDDHYGVAVLTTGGGYVEQNFSVPKFRTYTLSLSVKAAGATLSGSQVTARIVDGNGNTVTTQNLSGTADTWTANTLALGLAPGTTYTLRLTNSSAAGDVKIDDVWLWWVPKTRQELAARVHAKLARLASQRSLTTAATGTMTEGDYTYAVDSGLRQAGAIDPETDLPDVRFLDTSAVDTVLDLIEREMLERLQRDYAVEVDITVGPRHETLSQVAKSVGELTGTGESGGGSGRVIVRKLRHSADDYEMS
jgi:hypothetical protein